jgi:hypothetical protein
LVFQRKARQSQEVAEKLRKSLKEIPLKILENRLNQLALISLDNQEVAISTQIQFENLQSSSERYQFDAEEDQKKFEDLQINAEQNGSYEDSKSYLMKATFAKDTAQKFQKIAIASRESAKNSLLVSESYSNQDYEKKLSECMNWIVFQNVCRSMTNSDHANSRHNNAKWRSYQENVQGNLDRSYKFYEESIYWDAVSKKENLWSIGYLIFDGAIIVLELLVIIGILVSLTCLIVIHLKRSKSSSDFLSFISSTFGNLLDEDAITTLKLEILDILRREQKDWMKTLGIAVILLDYFRAGIHIVVYDQFNRNHQSIESSSHSESDELDG